VNDYTPTEIREAPEQQAAALQGLMLAVMEERLAELEMQLVTEGYDRLGADYGGRELSRSAVRTIAALSRTMFVKNPLVNRAVTLQSQYVWAQGVQVQAADPETNAIVQAFLDAPQNKDEFSSHQARTLKEQDLQVDGNIFFVLFADEAAGTLTVRTMPPDEVDEIIANPNDRKEPWFYKRIWDQPIFTPDAVNPWRTESVIAYYPDWRYPEAQGHPPTIGGHEVRWGAPVYHVRVGCLSDMRFGVPETYQAIDWARSYKTFLENWATVSGALARFAWRFTTAGGASAVSALKSRLQSALTTAPNNAESNPPPAAGSSWISSGGNDLAPLRTSGAQAGADEGRRLLLMVCAAVGMPETFFGDVSVGTLATARSLDRPTELKFRDRQELWKEVWWNLCQRALDVAGVAQTPEARRVSVDFPPILEHDIAETVTAITKAATLDGKPLAGTISMPTLVRLLLTSLGVPDVDELVAQLAPEDQVAGTAQPAQPAQQASDIQEDGAQPIATLQPVRLGHAV
jgi:hypothetical protein